MNLETKFKTELSSINKWLLNHFNDSKVYDHPGYTKLINSMQYSLESGGKRFRPLLSLLTAKALGKNTSCVQPVALAVELIHTYSLIHDDLPCMDNDDTRRGKPSNHIVFGEDMALLAGDALLTESFNLLAAGFKDSSKVGIEVIQLFGRAAGFAGMVGGQSMDILVPNNGQSEQQVEWVHRLKTGALIQVAVEAAAAACGADQVTQAKFSEFAKQLGFAFQLADDIDDFDELNPEPTSFTTLHGIDATRKKLTEVTSSAKLLIAGYASDDLIWITDFNESRVG